MICHVCNTCKPRIRPKRFDNRFLLFVRETVSLNDLSMLEMDFGATVAMANAPLRVKQVAKYTTKSNEELGVAFAIEQLLARQEG